MPKKIIETSVGFLMILGMVALIFLALKVSGLTLFHEKSGYYKVFADFDNVGGLKNRAPVMVAGVNIGQVGGISLDPATFRAKVVLLIRKNHENLPIDTSANIYTQGLLGANYVNLNPGYEKKLLLDGGIIETTEPAIVLEKLIGQFIYNMQGKETKN